jgi:hypothetical protein
VRYLQRVLRHALACFPVRRLAAQAYFLAGFRRCSNEPYTYDPNDWKETFSPDALPVVSLWRGCRARYPHTNPQLRECVPVIRYGAKDSQIEVRPYQ